MIIKNRNEYCEYVIRDFGSLLPMTDSDYRDVWLYISNLLASNAWLYKENKDVNVTIIDGIDLPSTIITYIDFMEWHQYG